MSCSCGIKSFSFCRSWIYCSFRCQFTVEVALEDSHVFFFAVDVAVEQILVFKSASNVAVEEFMSLRLHWM